MRQLPKAVMETAALSLIIVGFVPISAQAMATAPLPIDPTSSEPALHGDSDQPTTQLDDLPEGLATAIERDLGVTPEEYFEAGAAAKRAGELIDQLADHGIAPGDVQVTHANAISVAVDGAAEARAVAALGATPMARAHRPTDAVSAPVKALSEAVPTGSKFVNAAYHACTLGFWGYDSQNRPVALTAGHCARNAPGGVSRMALTNPWSEVGTIANETFGSFHLGMYGSGYDASLVLADGEQEEVGYVDVVGEAGPQSVPVTGWTAPVVGASVCKSGARTGWTCGVITDLPKDFVVTDDGLPTVSGFSTSMCSASGDSGSPILTGTYAVGILSFGSFNIKGGDTEAACDMNEQVARFKTETLAAYSPSQRVAVEQILDSDPSRLILTGAQAMTGPGQTVESLFGRDFRLAVAMPTPKVLKKSATKNRTVVKGQIDLMGRVHTDYKVKVKVGPRSYTVVPDSNGNFTVKGARLKAKKATVSVRAHLATQVIQKSAIVKKELKSKYAVKKAKQAARAKSKK
ncbi:MAG: S1 family peptidase [Bifidobacteriaceae bacterium]|jgi:hypothetical protein|nr:S1 family peptidase [Bifidobacteriaceae bacterium]